MSLLPLGDRQYRAKDLAGARETYERALRLSPHNPAILYRMGYIQCQRGELAEAEAYLTQSLDVDPSFRPALATQGMVLRRRGEILPAGKERDAQLREAESRLRQALEGAPRLLDEDGESWWCTLGGLYRVQNRIDLAADAYQQAARITPYSSYPLGNLALYRGLKGDYDGMIQTYREVERLARMQAQANPEDYWAYADLLVARLALGKIQEAESILNVVLDIMPEEMVYAGPSLLAILERLLALVPEGRSHIETTIKHIRENTAARRNKADVHLRNESFVIPLGDLPALAVRVSNEDEPGSIVQVLDLDEARPAFFMLGGAMNMESEEMKITRTIIDEGIVPYAEQHRMAVVDGGTDSGVMKLMGDARTQQQATFPLIGVAPINLVKFEGHDNPNGYNLDPGHSHFVFTPEGDWGDETDMIMALTQALAGNGLKPSLGIVINGGQIVRQEVYRLVITESLRFPIIVLEGSGRFADTLAAAYHSGETDDDQLREIISSGQLDLVSLKDGPKGMQAKLDHYFKKQRQKNIP